MDKTLLIKWLDANTNAHATGPQVKKTPLEIATALKKTPAVIYEILLNLVSSGDAKQYRGTSSDRMKDSFSTIKATPPA